jgi:hypothetical protein
MRTIKHVLSSKRCPKTGTSHADELLALVSLAGLSAALIALQVPYVSTIPLGIPILVIECLLAIAFSVGGSLVVGIFMAKRRHWL